jgi:predicted metal-dependent hydrolase
MKLEIGDIDILVVKKDIKNIHLAVYPPNGKVRLAAPQEVNDETIRLFAISKISWIRKQQRKFKSQVRQSPRQYINRETHYFLGRKYLLKVEEVERGFGVSIKNKATIVLRVKSESTLESRKSMVIAWYREQLKKLLPNLIAKWEKTIGVQIEDWGVRQMRTKWGTCNIKSKKIWLNLELAKKPLICIEYIVVHELIHLLERNHNERFLAYMNKFMPQWKSHKEELNKLPVSHEDWEY